MLDNIKIYRKYFMLIPQYFLNVFILLNHQYFENNLFLTFMAIYNTNFP
jgi:hypothetical protein